MEQYIRQIQMRAQWRARRTGQFALGAALLCVSLGFLTAAVWAYLAVEFSPVLASLICGGFYFIAALGVLLIASASQRPSIMPFDAALKAELASRYGSHPKRATAPGERPPLFEAFLAGFDTFMKLRKTRD